MDFKSYVRMILESNEKAKDKDKEAEDEEDLDDEDSEEDCEDDCEDDEKKAAVKTGCTAAEASADTDCEDEDSEEDDDEEDSEDEDEDDDSDEKKASVKDKKKCPDCGKCPCACVKTPSLKEAVLMSAGYLNNKSEGVMTEEVRVLVEGIKNNSVSRYLSKLAKKAEKEAAKWTKKGDKEKASVSKKAASAMKEASNKIYSCETRYDAGDVSAKREYKQLCRQYSAQLKNLGKGSKRVFGTLAAVLAGAVLLGGVGLTAVANDDIIDKLNYGFQNKDKLPAILSGMAKKNGQALGDLVSALKGGEDAEGTTGERLAGAINKIKANADAKGFNSEGRVVDWKGQKADWDAQKAGYRDSSEQDEYERFGKKVGEKISDVKKKFGGTITGIKKTAKGTASGLAKGLKD